MWDCPHCGCKAIAESVTSCPMCAEPKGKKKPTTDRGKGAQDNVK